MRTIIIFLILLMWPALSLQAQTEPHVYEQTFSFDSNKLEFNHRAALAPDGKNTYNIIQDITHVVEADKGYEVRILLINKVWIETGSQEMFVVIYRNKDYTETIYENKNYVMEILAIDHDAISILSQEIVTTYGEDESVTTTKETYITLKWDSYLHRFQEYFD